jgi:hypothetical protein
MWIVTTIITDCEKDDPMTFKTPADLNQLIDDLSASDDANSLTNQASRALEQSCDVIEGLAMAAKRLGLGDVYGVLRSSINASGGEGSEKMLRALDMMDAMGVPTAEPDLDSILDPAAS